MKILDRYRRLGHGLGALLLAAIMLACSPARAETRSAACSSPLPIAAAAFTARPVSGGLRWDARYVLEVDATFGFCGGTIPLAVPLSADERLLPGAAVAAVTAGERVTGLRVEREAIVDRSIAVSFFQPGALLSDAAIGAPVSASEAVQVIELAKHGARFELERAAGQRLQKHLGYVAPPGVSSAAREEARRLAEIPERDAAFALYVRAQDVRALGALRGTIVESRAQSTSTRIAIGLVFAEIVGALALLARRLTRTAEVERADALLVARIDAVAGWIPASAGGAATSRSDRAGRVASTPPPARATGSPSASGAPPKSR